MNSIQLWYKMDTIFTNSEDSETSDSQRLILNLTDEANLKRSHKYGVLSNLNVYYTWKNAKTFQISAHT